MRNLQNLLLITLLSGILLSSCNCKNQLYPALLNLEESVSIAPGQVVDSLKKMNTTCLSQKEKALYYLLLVKGLEKCGSIPESDSLLAYPFAYYTNHDEKQRLSQLYYLQGEIFLKNNYLISATESYDQADKYAMDDHRMRFRLNIEMGRIYRYIMMEQEEDSCLSNALALAVELNDPILLSEANHNISLLHNKRKNYHTAKLLLNRAIDLLPADRHEIISEYYEEMSRIYNSTQHTDSALYYINLAIDVDKDNKNRHNHNIQKGDIFFRMNRLDSAEYYLMQNFDTLPLSQQVMVYHTMYHIKKKLGLHSEANDYLERHVMYRDSLDFIREEDYIERMNYVQAYKRQRKKADLAEMELHNNTVVFYRIVVISFLFIIVLMTISFCKEQRKRKLEQQLQKEKMYAMEVHSRQQRTEMQLLMEQKKRKKIEIKKLNQAVGYYKSLNAITIPVFLERQKGTMLHLTEEEWDTVIRNTNSCFDDFTYRLLNRHPQLTEDEIRFCCLIKMELSISLLSKIYHIANGSISRKKIRLKEKLGITNLSLDDFIHSF